MCRASSPSCTCVAGWKRPPRRCGWAFSSQRQGPRRRRSREISQCAGRGSRHRFGAMALPHIHHGARLGLALAALMVTAPAARAADFTHPVFTEFTGGGLSTNGDPASLALRPAGNLWMAETHGPGRIAQGTAPAAGREGNLWRAEPGGPGRIAKVPPAGAVTEFPGGGTRDRSATRGPATLGGGPDGNVGLGECAGPGGIGRIQPAGTVAEFPAG